MLTIHAPQTGNIRAVTPNPSQKLPLAAGKTASNAGASPINAALRPIPRAKTTIIPPMLPNKERNLLHKPAM